MHRVKLMCTKNSSVHKTVRMYTQIVPLQSDHQQYTSMLVENLTIRTLCSTHIFVRYLYAASLVKKVKQRQNVIRVFGKL